MEPSCAIGRPRGLIHGGHGQVSDRVNSHVADLQTRTRAAGMDYHLFVTDHPLDGALRQYLSLRQGRQ